jgi:hypothetical protein
MSQVLYPGASVTVSVAASDKIALYSDGSYVLTETVGYPNFPTTTDEISSVQSGSLTTSAFSAAQDVTIKSTGVFPVFYEIGTAAVVQGLRGQVTQGAPNALNATGALTAAMILGGIVTSTTAAGVTATLPTGAVLDAASSFDVDDAIDFSVINTGPDTFTVTAAVSGHTVIGNMAVTTGRTGRFRTRKTAADTFVTYSLAN